MYLNKYISWKMDFKVFFNTFNIYIYRGWGGGSANLLIQSNPGSLLELVSAEATI